MYAGSFISIFQNLLETKGNIRAVIVGDSGKVYATEAEAQAAIRTIKVCESK